MIVDYPQEWPRSIDFVPLLGIQSVLDKEMLLYRCGLEVSVAKSEKMAKSEMRKTEYGMLRADSIDRTKMRYDFGNREKKSPDEISLPMREILDDVNAGANVVYAGKFPDIIIKDRGVIEKIPRTLEEKVIFQGVDRACYLQEATGNFTKKLRRMTGLPFFDFYEPTKTDLITKLGLKPNDAIFKKRKLRSALKTKHIYTDAISGNQRGYDALGYDGVYSLEQELVKNKWWQDLGIANQMEARYDHTVMNGTVYRLMKKEKLIVL